MPGKTVVLTFNHEPPDTIFIGYLAFKTSSYVPLPLRCYRCQELNHTTAACISKTIKCSHCSGPHQYSECPSKATYTTPVCSNCGGGHNATFRQCPTWFIFSFLHSYIATHFPVPVPVLVYLKANYKALNCTEKGLPTKHSHTHSSFLLYKYS